MTKEQMRKIIEKHIQEKRASRKRVASKKVSPKRKVASRDAVAMKKAIAEHKVIAKQTSVLADRFAKKLDTRMEKILMDAEQLVKEYFPAKYVSASLTRLQKELINEGISCRFDKTVSKTARIKTAKSDITPDECKEAIDKIAKATVDATEETLDACHSAIRNVAKNHFPKHRISSTHSICKQIEAKMKETGLNFKF